MSARLPPGQALTRKFPVVGEKRSGGPVWAATSSLAEWTLEIDGLVALPRRWRGIDLLALPRVERTVDIHCVTGWSRFETHLSGWLLADLLRPAEPLAAARFARFEAQSPRRHDTSLPLAVALEDTWVVDRIDGEPLTEEHGGPLRTVTPSRYFYKSLKWLRRIELMAEDRLGYWERESSYHNVGDPWPGNQRFTTGSLDPEDLARLRAAESLAAWRASKRVLLGLDLRGWCPRDRDLRGLALKNCDLREVDFSGADLTGANLSLSNLRGADLRGARMRDADLEGADFSGADLSGADLSGSALSATRFVSRLVDGQALAAEIGGMHWEGATGLLEDQEEFLREGNVG